ncbi:hypothetical protein [Flavilitoribacter nigricans]|uniref:Uncharacterized protein n=1 Tax=Flavilitoribacter nigricans (strain ATCC 23147 / DSM 23189 / NBRC 102662 / NCIMB 1420 / SS-2) TaxID=1122177 RepID=A0A2D0NDQ9_FLAN2|nr:hypothetical protein [Flavilitoribacter nigricans]PHN06506.1 hypothetical protein CRP01_09365 [Flavilitoribacter nigricans DSM 23189 = NBRC 102662]
MKTSNKFILITLALLGLATLSYSAYLVPHLEAKAPENGQLNRELSLSDHEAIPRIMDSISGTYHHIWTNFSPLYLDTESDGQAISRCLNPVVANHIQMEITNDTLFVRYEHPDGIPGNTVFNMQDYVLASAQHLQGVTVSGYGDVLNISPFDKGRRFEDVPGNDPHILTQIGEKPPLQAAQFQLHLENGGMAQLHLETDVLEVSADENNFQNNSSRAYISGRCRSLVINHRDTYFHGDTYRLAADSVRVYTRSGFNQPDGLIKVRAETFLHADMDGWTDVLYQGNPVTKKRERGPGRLVKAGRIQ